MPFFDSPDGVRLHYAIEGRGAPLLLHLGAGADSHLWRAAGYIAPLATSHTCILFDHRGHGESDHPASVAANHIDRYAADVAALVRHLGYKQVSFFGWSTGATVGLKTADDHPDLFDALILFGAIGRALPPEQLAVATQERLKGMREKGWRFILDDMVAAEPLPVRQWFLDRVMATDTRPWFAYTESRPLWNWNPWEPLSRIQTPSLLLAGELEDPDDVLAEVASLMPNAKRVRIPNREHINAFLGSDIVVPMVHQFLEGARAGGATQG